MPRLPDSRRRIAGISLMALVVALGVLYLLRRIPPRSPESGRPASGAPNQR